MLFLNLPPRVLGPLSSVLMDIKVCGLTPFWTHCSHCSAQLLNSLSGSTDIASVIYFDPEFEESPAFPRKLDVLLTWSVTPLQYGDHRTYAASSLLSCWRDRAKERSIRRDRASPNDFVQDHLFDWLDSNDVVAQPESLQAVASLFTQLIRRELFSYEHYIQRLIARGEMGLCATEVRFIARCSLTSANGYQRILHPGIATFFAGSRYRILLPL